MRNMRVLRGSKAVEILLALLKGPKHVRELQSEVGGSASTIQDRIQGLLKEGLIRERKLESWPFRIDLELTEKGKEIVRIIEYQGGILSLGAPYASEERAEWIIALLHAVGGKIKGRLRLQKLMFLLKHEYGIEIPYEFTPYMYGPYSADIFEDLGALKGGGLLEIQGQSIEPREMVGDPAMTMSFNLTEKGGKKAREIHKKLPEKVKRVLPELNRFNKMSLGELIKYVYDNYPHESLGASA